MTTTTLQPQKPSPFNVFRHRDFTLMWIGQHASTAGTALTSLAASILVYRQTGLALSVRLVLTPFQMKTVLMACAANIRRVEEFSIQEQAG